MTYGIMDSAERWGYKVRQRDDENTECVAGAVQCARRATLGPGLKTTARMDLDHGEAAQLYERKNVTFHLASISFHKV